MKGNTILILVVALLVGAVVVLLNTPNPTKAQAASQATYSQDVAVKAYTPDVDVKVPATK